MLVMQYDLRCTQTKMTWGERLSSKPILFYVVAQTKVIFKCQIDPMIWYNLITYPFFTPTESETILCLEEKTQSPSKFSHVKLKNKSIPIGAVDKG